MKKLTLNAFCIIAVMIFSQGIVNAHCQIPCGIFEDELRFQTMQEEVTTIKKAMVTIKKLSEEKNAENSNQMVRWINTKEEHANNLIKTACDYFLAQRIKPEQNNYLEMLKNIHSIIVLAMKSKQSLAEENCDKLLEELKKFNDFYQKRDKNEGNK
ncbi:MAG: superoxide dismutase [Ni] [Lentisphaeria bacterium]